MLNLLKAKGVEERGRRERGERGTEIYTNFDEK
jgi:hypothetical protein